MLRIQQQQAFYSSQQSRGLGGTVPLDPHFIFELIRGYEKRCFPWMQSIEDRDLFALIGANKDGISCKQLYLAGIAPVATAQRRLRRLIKLGVLHKRQSDRDARVFYVCLSGSAEGSVELYLALLKSSALSLNNDASFAPIFSDRSALRNSSSPPLPLRDKLVKTPS